FVGFIFVESAAALVGVIGAARCARRGRAGRAALLDLVVRSAALRTDEAFAGRTRRTASGARASLACRLRAYAGALVAGQRVSVTAGLALAARALTAEVGALARRRSRAGIAVVAADR